MNFLPPLFLTHSFCLLVAIMAVGLPVADATIKKRGSSWMVALVVFYLVSYGLYGIEELVFRDVWPSYFPMISLALGLAIAVLHRVALAFLDRRRRT